jgi:hypothetical protein
VIRNHIQSILIPDAIHETSQGTNPIQHGHDETEGSSDDEGDPTLQVWREPAQQDGCNSSTQLADESSDTADLDTTFFAGRGRGSGDFDALRIACSSLRLAITYLYKIPLRAPTSMARLKDLPAGDDELMRFYEVLDRRHVSQAFPEADERLTARLAVAITQRRRMLKHWERRKQNLTTTKPGDGEQDTGSVTATTLRPDVDPPPLDTAPSEAGTMSTIASSVQAERLRLPKRPTADSGEALEDFECPCCLRAVHISAGERAWK